MMHVHRTRQGFTLIEILIVGALLALFAGLAIFNIKEMYDSNLKKAAVGEARNLGTACAMAQQDLSFIPKFNYLTEPQKFITTEAGVLRADFDFMGFINPNNPEQWPPNNVAVTSRFAPRGYYAFSQSRGGLNVGRGGIVTVRLPSGASGSPSGQDDAAKSLVRWPADPWGQPYVLYLLKTHKTEEGETAKGPDWRFISELNESPDYMVAVVSYGPNKYPGSIWEKRNSGDPYGRGVGQVLNYTTPAMADARLYTDGDRLGGPAQFSMLTPAEIIWDGSDTSASGRRMWAVKGPSPTDTAEVSTWKSTLFPTDGLPGGDANLEFRGILDQGSDDIVYVF